MPQVAVDVAFELPPDIRQRALSSSALLSSRMATAGHPSAFKLGHPLPGSGSADPCEPHVSLFKLQVDESEIDEVLVAVGGVAAAFPVLTVAGHRWAYNSCGAAELYFHRSAGWTALQRAVVAAVEPIRRGRLRGADPAGDRLAEIIELLRRDEPEGPRLRQLLRYGYDEIADEGADLFRPHVTVVWPLDNSFRVMLDGLAPSAEFDGVLTGLTVFAIQANGTCGRRYGGAVLRGHTG